MPELAWVNGKVSELSEAAINCQDRGFVFGDGVYEVIRVYGGRPFALDPHLIRLESSLEAIRLRVPWQRPQLAAIISDLLACSQLHEAQIYIQVTRGIASRQHTFPAGVDPTLVCLVSRVEPLDDLGRRGVKAITLPDDRWAHCHIKSLNLLPNVLAKESAKTQGAAEAIFVREDNLITEGSSSNVFALLGHTLTTPPADGRILAGITRQYFIDLARRAGIAVVERAISLQELRSAGEVFVTSTVREFLPVIDLDGGQIGSGGPGEVGQELYSMYRALCQR